jgi:hypothetical protein
MEMTDFQMQLDQALDPSLQRTLHMTLEDTEAGPHAVFTVSGESWAITYADARHCWQVHAPNASIPLWFSSHELMPSLLVLRAYRLSQLDHEQRQAIRAQLDQQAFTVRGDDGQAVTLSPQAALELLDVLTVCAPKRQQLVRGAGE